MYQYMHAVHFTCYFLEIVIFLFVGSLGSQTKESPMVPIGFVMFYSSLSNSYYEVIFLPLCLLIMGVG